MANNKKAELREERGKGIGINEQEYYDDSEGSDSQNEEDIVRFSIQYNYLA